MNLRTLFIGVAAILAFTNIIYAVFLLSIDNGLSGGGDLLVNRKLGQVLQPGGRPIVSGESRHFVLPRSMTATMLEYVQEESPQLGICHDSLSRLPQVDHHYCEPLVCLYSTSSATNVDLCFGMFSRLDLKAHPVQCPLPYGGQLGESTLQLIKAAEIAGDSVPKRRELLPHLPAPSFEVTFVLATATTGKMTAQCLGEVYRTAREVRSAEYIIVDHGMDPGTMPHLMAILSYMDELFGVEVRLVQIPISAQATSGVAKMTGIKAARGEYVVLIDSHVLVSPGWLNVMMHTLKDREGHGHVAVGPLILTPHGQVLSAGGIIYQDGTGAYFGVGLNSSAREVAFMRDTHFLPSSCLLFNRTAFIESGVTISGQFQSQLYEDLELGLQLGESGWDMLYQPFGLVFVDPRTDPSTVQLKTLGEAGLRKDRFSLLKRWMSRLGESYCPRPGPGTLDVNGLSRSHMAPKLLWVDLLVPEPDHDSGSIRTTAMLKLLLEQGFDISFQPLWKKDESYILRLRFLGVDVLEVEDQTKWPMQQEGLCKYDLILVARRYVFEVTKKQLLWACPDVAIIYDTVDLHFLREARNQMTLDANGTYDMAKEGMMQVLAWLEGDNPAAAAIRPQRDVELSHIDTAQLTLVVSADEIDVIRHYRPTAQIKVLSNIHDSLMLPAVDCPSRNGIIFVGHLAHVPNQQAIIHIITDILPIIKANLPTQYRPDFMVHIVGSDELPDHVQKVMMHAKLPVMFHGYLTDDELSSLYMAIKVAIAPLMSGAGVKGKVNQAMKYGVPVVATRIAVEGMHVHDGDDCLVADNLKDFAMKIIQVYSNCTLWEHLTQGGFRNLKQYFSYDAARLQLLDALRAVDMNPLPQHQRLVCAAKRQHAQR